MPKKLTLLLVLLISSNALSQDSNNKIEPLFINLFISADKTIYVETEETSFQDINKEVSQILRNSAFKVDQKVVYRIFADENLLLGYIIDVNNEMLSAYKEDVKTKRFLLNTSELNIDGQDWFKTVHEKVKFN